MNGVHTPLIPFYIPWHLGRDHLIESCPALQRARVKPYYGFPHAPDANYLESGPTWFHLPDPNGDVCAWCSRVWLARNPTDHQPCDCAERDEQIRQAMRKARDTGGAAVLAVLTGPDEGAVLHHNAGGTP